MTITMSTILINYLFTMLVVGVQELLLDLVPVMRAFVVVLDDLLHLLLDHPRWNPQQKVSSGIFYCSRRWC
jgi:hypothetical protein